MKTRAAVMLLALSLAGVARTQDQRLDVSGFAGALTVNHDLGTASNLFLTVTGNAENVAFGNLYGIRAGYHLFRDIIVEGSYTRSTGDFSSAVQDNVVGAFDPGQQFTADQSIVSGNILIHFDLERSFVPFVTAGAGWATMTPQNPIADLGSVKTLDVNVGGGLKYFFLRSVGARVDARYHFFSKGLQYAGGGGSSPRHFELSVGGIVRLF